MRGRHKRVHRQNPERRWRVNDHVLVVFQDGSERVLQLEWRVELSCELLLELRQRESPWSHKQQRIFRRPDDGGDFRTAIAQHVEHRNLYVREIEKRNGSVGLRVEI